MKQVRRERCCEPFTAAFQCHIFTLSNTVPVSYLHDRGIILCNENHPLVLLWLNISSVVSDFESCLIFNSRGAGRLSTGREWGGIWA